MAGCGMEPRPANDGTILPLEYTLLDDSDVRTSFSLVAMSAKDHILGLAIGDEASVWCNDGGDDGEWNLELGRPCPWYAGCIRCGGAPRGSYRHSGESGSLSGRDSLHSLPVSAAAPPMGRSTMSRRWCVERSPSSLEAVPESLESIWT